LEGKGYSLDDPILLHSHDPSSLSLLIDMILTGPFGWAGLLIAPSMRSVVMAGGLVTHLREEGASQHKILVYVFFMLVVASLGLITSMAGRCVYR